MKRHNENMFLRFQVSYQCVNAYFESCINHELKHACSILIKILLEITLSDFMFTTRGSNDCVVLDESINNTQCF